MEVQSGRHLADKGPGEAAELGQIHHVRGQDQIWLPTLQPGK
jgi:hypothetical protein